MRLKLTAKENHETGEIGWQDSRIRSDAYGSLTYPLGLAHDCLEHAAFDSVADEIEAHGAMYWVRYEGGWYDADNGRNLDMESFSSEWTNLVQGLAQEPFLPTPPKTRPLEDCIEEDISTIIESGRALCVREFCEGEVREEYKAEQRAEIEKVASVFRAYFRRGYRKAMRRYKGLAACEVAALFSALTDAFKRQRVEYEGQEITVTVNLKTQRVTIEEMEVAEY